MFTLPALKIGNPINYEALTVFPLFGENGGGGDVDYVLSDAAIASEAVVVTEVSEGGSVPDLLVENRGDSRVLFLEGEELVGAKQNRVLNVSVMIAAHTKTPVPVSCVEQGRWGYRGRKFGSGGHSSSKLRHIVKRSVHASLKATGGHSSDQGAVWKEVRRQQHSLGTDSPTSAMSDTYRDCESRISQFHDSLQPADGALGMAVAVGGKVISVDVLDKPSTCQKVWGRL